MVDTEGVQLAVAMVLNDPAGSQRLVAYFSPDSVETSALVASLKERLPAHFLPSLFVPMAHMPLLPNEKVDRKALPQPDWCSRMVEEYVAPVNHFEERLQAVWQAVLGQERISTHEDFFAVGGNSLQVRREASPRGFLCLS